ncbi:MAG: glycoside hydrolase family 88 protein [Flavisolibacter sp.]
MRRKKFLMAVCLLAAMHLSAQKWSQEVAALAMKDLDSPETSKTVANNGLVLKGIQAIWQSTGEGSWFRFVEQYQENHLGVIKDLESALDGKTLLLLYKVTGRDKYRKAADTLYAGLPGREALPKFNTQEAFEDLYRFLPFRAEYAQAFHIDSVWGGIAGELGLVENHAFPLRAGDSKGAWGWYGMSLVDALDYFPEKGWARDSVIHMLNRFARITMGLQDGKTGLWGMTTHQMDNLPPAALTSMMVYTLAKSVRKGYVPSHFLSKAKKGYKGLLDQFIRSSDKGVDHYGLSGSSAADTADKISAKNKIALSAISTVRGAFINAAIEMEMLPTLGYGRGKKILLDCFFNNEWKKDARGSMIRYHYTWDDMSNNGFSLLGKVFNRYGVQTDFLETAPNAQNLKGADFYLIVDPDTEKETEKPNFMNGAAAGEIASWVKAGGVLILMGNDVNNAELSHFNILASRFGITFNMDDYNLVKDDRFDQGSVLIPSGNEIFHSAKKIFIKEMATLSLTGPARSILKKEGKHIMAVAAYGKGRVFVVGDPWLYNEYFDGRKLPGDFDNYRAGEDLVRWMLGPYHRKEGRVPQ